MIVRNRILNHGYDLLNYCATFFLDVSSTLRVKRNHNEYERRQNRTVFRTDGRAWTHRKR